MKNIISKTAIAVLASTFVISANAEKPKAGFIYVGPIGDHGWSYQHDIGRLAVEKAGYETTYVESVPEGADAERTIRDLAVRGYNPIFTTSFGYMDATNKVAKDFPDIKFEHATGFKRGPNVSNYAGRFYEGRYVIGQMAGSLTKTNKIGYIGSFPIPEVVRGINSALLGAQSVNPDAEIHVIWVNSWFDPGKEATAATTLIDKGIDIIMQHTDSPAVMQKAEERGIWAFGQASDMHSFGPTAQATAIVDSWDDYYVARVKAVENGTWESSDTWGGFNSKMVYMSDYSDKLPADVVKRAKETTAAISAGTLHPFTGPISSQDGEVKINAGSTADDGMLLGMDWYIPGVKGNLN